MKICVIFRGENIRQGTFGTIDCSLNVSNWNKTIFNDLKDAGHLLDIVFITYPSNILDKLVKLIQPIEVKFCEYISNPYNFNIVGNYINEKGNKYDRYIILRFEFLYKLRITQWPNIWNINSVIFMCPDGNFEKLKWTSDFFFIVDKDHIKNFIKGIKYMLNYPKPIIHTHFISPYFYENNLPCHLMYNYHLPPNNNPIYVWIKCLEIFNEDIVNAINNEIK